MHQQRHAADCNRARSCNVHVACNVQPGLLHALREVVPCRDFAAERKRFPMHDALCMPSPLGSPLPHLCRDWAHPCHICTGSGLDPATSASGLGSQSGLRLGPPLPHLHRNWARPPDLYRDWAHPCHVCTGTGLTLPRLHRDFGVCSRAASASQCTSDCSRRTMTSAALTSSKWMSAPNPARRRRRRAGRWRASGPCMQCGSVWRARTHAHTRARTFTHAHARRRACPCMPHTTLWNSAGS